MKTLSLISFLVLTFIHTGALTQEYEKRTQFAQDFIEVVAVHQKKKILKFLDKSYRKEQLKNLENDKIQLVDELFGGSDILNEDVYVNIKIDEITSIEIAEIIPLNGNEGYTYIFRVKTAEHDVYSSLLLKKTGKKYGFVGAFG